MNEVARWLMYELILLNLMAFCFGALFGINLERLQQYLEEKEVEKDEDL